MIRKVLSVVALGAVALLIVGDAAMHPAELLEPYGNIDPRRTAGTPSRCGCSTA